MPPTPKTRVILDTDIGDDIDDALALGLILASPELDLVGVTTVFGNTVARARQARTILAVAGRPEVPVAAGIASIAQPRLSSRGTSALDSSALAGSAAATGGAYGL